MYNIARHEATPEIYMLWNRHLVLCVACSILLLFSRTG